jgi:DNA-binding transcriptional LysR family regulator
MEFRELRAFVAVIEERGFSAAARRLHVSQSALSQTVQSLERQLGVQLLTRTHAGARPTDPGDVLLREARTLIEQHDQAVAAVAAASGQVTTMAGVLRVGVPLEFPVDRLPAAIAELGAEYPDTRVEVRHASSADQLAELRARDLDVALVRDRPADPDLDTVLCVQETMGVILATARSTQLADAAGVRLDRLARLEWVRFPRSEAPAWYDHVAATLRVHGIELTDTDRRDEPPVTPEVKLAAVGTGRAFALASPGWARPLPAGMTWHRLVGNPIVRRTWAVWHAEARQRDLAALVAALELVQQH